MVRLLSLRLHHGHPELPLPDAPPRKRFYDRFETISHFLSPKEPPPSMHLNRTDDEDGLQLPYPITRRKSSLWSTCI